MSVDQDNEQCPTRRLLIALLKQRQLDAESLKLVQSQVTKMQPLTPRWNDQIEDNNEYIQKPYSDFLEQDPVQSLLDDLNRSIVKANSLRELLLEEQEKNQALKDQMKEEIKAKAAALRDMQGQQRQRDKLQTKMETLTSVLEQRRRAVEELQDKYEAICNQMKEEMKAKTAAQNLLLEEQEKNQALKDQMKEEIMGKVAAEGDVMKLQKEKEKLETEVLSLRNALEQESHAKDSLKAEVFSLRSSLDKEKTKISAPTQEKIDTLQMRVLKTKQKMEGLKETHAQQLWTEKQNVQEISEALTTAENNNSALTKEYKDRQEATEVKQERSLWERSLWALRKRLFRRGVKVHPMNVPSV
uniref:Uncharacterized protein n=1 Tax=Knipowitschia caucasica TaxID=637954 RepID=A0AAV2LK50_KNICA